MPAFDLTARPFEQLIKELEKDMTLVLVYGTLKKGHGNHHLLEGQEFLGEHLTDARFTMFSCGGFPACTAEGSTAIHTECYRVDSDCLKRLDRLEGSPHWYYHEKVETPWGEAIMYVQPVKDWTSGNAERQDELNARKIPSGKWEGRKY